jgi:RsiW-degrading membrane proteinase PrsW (M82 family)
MSIGNDALLVILGLLPSLLWIFFFLQRDSHPEPNYLLTKTFLMGIIISPLAVFLQASFSKVGAWGPPDIFAADGSLFFLWAALVEEFLKFLAVWIIALRDPAFDEPVDAMIYMMMAGLGFAAIENILVLFRTIPNGIHATLTIWILRSVGATLLHALSCSLMGYFLALSWFFRHHQKKLIVLGLTVATLFHFAFNTFLAGSLDQLRGLALATGLLCVMAFLVFLLFDKIKGRNPHTPRLSPAAEKEINSV